MKRLFVLTWVALLLLACGDDGHKKLKAPANLTAEVVAEDQVNLSWEDRSGNETGFEIQRALQGEEFRLLTRANAEATFLSDETVALGAVYSYRIRAVSGTERSFYSNTAEVEVVVDRATAPTPPTNLQAAEVTATTLTLTWEDTATNETGFEIERSRQADFTDADTLAADVNETRYEDSQLTPETQYYYRVRATNAVGESAYSQPLAVQTAALPVSAPQAPADLSAQPVSPSRITLAWRDNSNNEEGFIIMGSLDGSTFDQVDIAAANVRTYSHEGLTPETTYYYKVLAFNSAGQSPESGVAQAETQAEPLAPPTAPDGLTYSELTSNSVRLTWADRSDDEEGFRLERAPSSDFALVDSFTLDPNVTTYQDINLLPSTDYYYRIRAFNQEGDSTVSDQIQVHTPDQVVVLPAPSALGLQDATASAITLSWQDNSDDEEGFLLERAEDEAFTAATVIDIEADETGYTDTGLSAETTYYYRISAYLGQQTSDYANTLEATTDPLPLVVPAAPSLLQTTSVSASSIALSWQDNADNEEGFHLERAEDEDFTAATVIDIEADETSYTDTGLSAETTYYYRISAYLGQQASDYGDTLEVTTDPLPLVVPAAPSLLQTTSVSASSIALSWQDNADNEEGFHLERAEDEDFTAATVIDIEADETSYTDAGLSAETTYYYRISAYLGQQASDYGNTVEATTDPLPAVVPEAPTLLQTTSVLHNRIALSWQDNADNEEGFHLERDEDEAFTAATVIDIEADETTYEDTGLTADTTYHYRIQAYNSVGNSAYTDPISASTETEPPVDASYIADYTVAKESVLRRIPQSAISAAKEDLKIMYCGTSHSSQVVDGMRGLMEYKSGDDSLYHVTFNGTAVSGALNIHYRPSGVYSTAQDLSHDTVDADGHTAYFRTTETYLDANTDCNVVMWSWCAIGGHDVTIYLDNFAELIEMYRAGGSKERTVDDAVTFVFMTGYAFGSDGDTPEPPYTRTPYQNYKRIRDYCETNGYFCLDYWTQDTYNYGDDSYKPTENGNTNVQHLAWVNDSAHELGSDWFQCRTFNSGSVALPAHANQHLTGNRRAYAAWWIFARIAGWDGTLE